MSPDKISDYLAVRPTQFRFLKKLVIEKLFAVSGSSSCDIDVVLFRDAEPNASYLHLRFSDATDIRIGNVNASVSVFLNIRSISSYKLEGRRYRVTDEENEVASFDCRDFNFFVGDTTK